MLDYLIDDPALRVRSPGEELAIAVARAAGGDAAVRLRAPLTTLFPLASTRPRPTVREQAKGGTVTDRTLRYVREHRDTGRDAERGTRYDATPEAVFRPAVAKAELTEISVAVPVPADLCADPALLARFVDHRVTVRLCTVENEVLLHGSGDGAIPGLLRLDGLRRRAAPQRDARAGGVMDALMSGCAEVEEMGGSCDGLVMHPALYWRLVGGGALPSLDAAGLRVTRTRMIGRDRVLLGDFRAGITLLDGEESTLALRRPAGDGDATISAAMRLGLAVHLPQHFLLLAL
ncbi:family 3 encapsulin nanocompartment shell protein [Actinomadura formosensis]|uniref:family 3 encapsulin nanocompartment shell protein n=1 Tax=Actinomadura formosensis TaxID=60706 RepID=UPI000A3FA6EE|nr:family 3 encapsulin nanocompartment shell protein [Actinomadura formosensis]